VAASSSSQAPPTGKAVVAFLGDDWAAGVGASEKSKRFTSLVSKDLDVRERNFGVDGSGYAAASSSDKNYAARVAQVVAVKPQVVVVTGGRNDVVQDEADTAATDAGKLFAALHSRLPNAQLVAVAPMWGDSAPPDELATLAKAIKAAVNSNGGTYLDISDPVRGHPSYMAGDADPGDAGYAAIARALRTPLGRAVSG
jgi:lysophospholipase L1-like esterase